MLPPYPPLLPLPLLLLLAVGAELSVEAADFVPSNTDVSMVAVGVSSCPNCTAADTNCIPSSLGWSAGTVQLDASFGGPQPGYLATADGSGTLLWSFQAVGSVAGVYRIGAVAGDGSGPEESGNWCLRPQACGSSPALYECEDSWLFHDEERWRVVLRPGSASLFTIENVGCAGSGAGAPPLGLQNQTNALDNRRCYLAGILDHSAATALVDIWQLDGFTGPTHPGKSAAARGPHLAAVAAAAALGLLWAAAV